MAGGRGWHLSLTHPADGVDGLCDVAAVNLRQFPAREQGSGFTVGTRPACPAPKRFPAPGPYASFLCFSLVLASEILLWRFLSRIFCSSFFSLEGPVGKEEGSVAGLGALPLSWHQGVPAPRPPSKTLCLHLSFISFSLLT